MTNMNAYFQLEQIQICFRLRQRNNKNFMPDLIINAAAKVGGIYANDTQGTQFYWIT